MRRYDDVVRIDAAEIAPTVTWGINPGQAISVKETHSRPPSRPAERAERALVHEALAYMQLSRRAAHRGHASQRRVHRKLHQRTPLRFSRSGALHQGQEGVAGGARARGPGLDGRRAAAEAEGLDKVFREAGFEWREPGCSMCLAMNPDKLIGDELCASSSNRNFKGRQGSSTGRTVLMSPVMVAAAAVRGAVADAREVFALD